MGGAYFLEDGVEIGNVYKYNLAILVIPSSSSINEDINELGGYKSKISKPTTDYVVYLGDLNQSSLNAHIYLNYLAIMFGGQMIKSKVPGSGKMYEFEGDMRELIGSVRAIQNDEMADEVNKGFQYIINILDELQKNIR
jgi:hypothetical protein